MNTNNLKIFIGMILIVGALIALIVAAIWATVFHFQNPDMTELRLVLENPYPTVIAAISLVMGWVGKRLLGVQQ